MQLTTHTFDSGRPGPHLLVIGGVHGDEFEPIASLRRLVALFENKAPKVQDFQGRVTIVPIVNEAAFLRGHRTAEDGLDLARICPGRPDGSVTERTAHAISELIRTADAFIDLHTGGTELTVLPFTGYKMHADAEVLGVQRRMARAFGLPVIWGTSPSLEGRTLSVARDAGIPTIYAEYLGGATCRAEGVEAYLEGCLNVMGELGVLDREVPEPTIEHLVEDSREGAGHMQVCNPSPITGYFEPAAALGDRIHPGDLLGTVYDLAGKESHPVTSTQDGLVLVLRTFPRVHEGETVGVVMEFVAY
jgi:predicted deacylase